MKIDFKKFLKENKLRHLKDTDIGNICAFSAWNETFDKLYIKQLYIIFPTKGFKH